MANDELFSIETRRDGRPAVHLRGVRADGGVTVEASVHPVGAELDDPPLQRPFPFPSREAATRFVDETLTALQYLGCTVTE